MKQIGDKVSYVRTPFAKHSFCCFGLGLVSLGLAVFSLYLSASRAGQGELNTGAYGFSSIAACVMGLWYGFLSFGEKDRNYILARIGIAISGVLLIVWTVIILTGLFR